MSKASTKRAAIYCRVSTADQSCERQVSDLTALAKSRGFEVIATYKETASGMKNDRKQRAEVMKLAQAGKIDAILCSELSRWGRSTTDLLSTLEQLSKWNVSVLAQSGGEFDMTSATGKALVGLLSVMSEFERNLIRERTISGLKSAIARGKTLGRPKVNDSKRTTSKHREAVQDLLKQGFSYREISTKLKIGKDTIGAIAKAQ
jgi:putative DNA-invertase from lambdoid prophage Rac